VRSEARGRTGSGNTAHGNTARAARASTVAETAEAPESWRHLFVTISRARPSCTLIANSRRPIIPTTASTLASPLRLAAGRPIRRRYLRPTDAGARADFFRRRPSRYWWPRAALLPTEPRVSGLSLIAAPTVGRSARTHLGQQCPIAMTGCGRGHRTSCRHAVFRRSAVTRRTHLGFFSRTRPVAGGRYPPAPSAAPIGRRSPVLRQFVLEPVSVRAERSHGHNTMRADSQLPRNTRTLTFGRRIPAKSSAKLCRLYRRRPPDS
jgi:hypothetical protein